MQRIILNRHGALKAMANLESPLLVKITYNEIAQGSAARLLNKTCTLDASDVGSVRQEGCQLPQVRVASSNATLY